MTPPLDPRYAPTVRVPELDRPGKIACVLIPYAAERAVAWDKAIRAKGGRGLLVNNGGRTVAQQQPFRDAYMTYLSAVQAWERAGKPKGKRPAPVPAASKPGRSGHQAMWAVDCQTGDVFPSEPANKQVDGLWGTGGPLNWQPIIGQPDENRLERWHFDCIPPEWAWVRQVHGYDIVCLCGALDVGQAGEWQSDARLIQALLLRLGFDIGEPDGIPGSRTHWALVAAGLDSASAMRQVVSTVTKLRAMTPGPYRKV